MDGLTPPDKRGRAPAHARETARLIRFTAETV
jgi:hypothetical protein